MNTKQLEHKLEHINVIEFEHLMFEQEKDEHTVTLVDAEGYKITKGYGSSIIEAINDLHHNYI